MTAKAEERSTPRVKNGYALLQSGDRMDQPTFHELYKQTPDGFKAELIGGVVYVASPVSYRHGVPHLNMGMWLALYVEDTVGTQGFDNSTTILGDDSEPQPDLGLRIKPEYGGQTRNNEEKMIVGPSELVIEIANSSVSLDTHAKKRDYEKAGVLEYIIVLAKIESVVWFVRGKSGFVEHKPDADGLLKSRVFPGLWLDPTVLFHESTKQLRTTLERGLATPEHAAFVKKLEAKRAALAKKTKPKS